MNSNDCYPVAFFLGPFDGHIEHCSLEPELLPEQLICYISTNTLRKIYGLPGLDRGTVTSAVIYAKRWYREKWSYFFIEAVAPESVSIKPL